METRPFVSIVMPSFNQAHFIRESVESILRQSYANLELIIQDGNSNDGTKEILKDLQDADNRIRWFSEADAGPAEAINRALRKARGTLIGWLNSDDLYATKAIENAINEFNKHPDILMVYGQGEHIDEQGRALSRYPTRPPDKAPPVMPHMSPICQPTVFFKRVMYVLLGGLDQSLKTAFDYEYWYRAFDKFPARIGFVNRVQAMSRLHEKCITLSSRTQVAEESMQVVSRYEGSAPIHWAVTSIEEIKQKESHPGEYGEEIRRFISRVKYFLTENDFRTLSRQTGG